MYQTAGGEVIPAMAECMSLPLYRRRIAGRAHNTVLEYSETSDDEVEDLVHLLSEIRTHHPDAAFVASGAILSTYQRLRVENVCARLGLESLAPLWQREQGALLDEMLEAGLRPVMCKVATLGLDRRHLNVPLGELLGHLKALASKYGMHVCGEGGEYESLVLDCPLFVKARIELDRCRVDSAGSEAWRLTVESFRLLPPTAWAAAAAAAAPPLPDPVLPRTRAGSARVTGHGDARGSMLGPFIGHSMAEALAQLEAALGGGDSLVCFVLLALSDMSGFAKANAEYEAVFSKRAPPPSRATIELDLPGGCVAVFCVCARVSKSALQVRSRSAWAPATIGPYAQASVLDGRAALVAGQIGLEPLTMTLAAGLRAQAVLAQRHATKVLSDAHIGAAPVACLAYVSTRRGQLDAEGALRDAAQCLLSDCLLLAVPCLPRNALIEVEVLGARPDASIRVEMGLGPRAGEGPGWLRGFVCAGEALEGDGEALLCLEVQAVGLLREGVLALGRVGWVRSCYY